MWRHYSDLKTHSTTENSSCKWNAIESEVKTIDKSNSWTISIQIVVIWSAANEHCPFPLQDTPPLLPGPFEKRTEQTRNKEEMQSDEQRAEVRKRCTQLEKRRENINQTKSKWGEGTHEFWSRRGTSKFVKNQEQRGDNIKNKEQRNTRCRTSE